MIAAGIYFVGCFFYWFWVSGEIQQWAQKTSENQFKQSDTENGGKNVVGNTNQRLEICE